MEADEACRDVVAEVLFEYEWESIVPDEGE